MMRVLAWIILGSCVVLLGALWWLWTPDKPRAALEAAHAPPPSQFVTIDGLRLHLRDTGPRDAPALVLLHGFASSLHTWEVWAQILQSERRVIRLDLPGFALTGPDPSGDYSDERFIALLDRLLDHLNLAQVDLLGSSMGGRLAWRFAAARPGRVRSLILMAPDGFASAGFTYGKPAGVPPAMRALPYTLPMALLRGGLEPAYADKAVLSETMAERYRDMMLVPGVRHAILDRMRAHVLAPPEPILRGIRAPVLLLWGEQDRMVPASHAPDYARELPDSRTVILPGIGHVPMEEDPARSLVPVLEFLRVRG